MKLANVRDFISRLHKDEKGDIPIGPLLLIGLVAIPIVIALVAFGDNLVGWLNKKWTDLTNEDLQGFNKVDPN